MSLSAIIVAAGSGRRMGFDKLLSPLHGKPVLWWSIEAFTSHPEVSDVIVVCPADRFDAVCSLPPSHFEKVQRVDGGAERHLSVAEGLSALPSTSQYCAIHDGARPLISTQAIDLCYRVSQETGAASLARPATETIKRVDTERNIYDSISRDNLWFMETPQIFRTNDVCAAYEKVTSQGTIVTDEVSALQLIGIQTKVVANPDPNPKLTFPADLKLAELLIQL